MRVVSVLPSATEIVFALGHGPQLVGRSAECDFPPEARALPVVMAPKVFDAERPSREIDDRVQRVRSARESLYALDIELLRRLEPDVILTQDLCGVCSVTDAEVAAACARADVAPLVVSLTPRTLSGVWQSVEQVGRALDDPAAGASLARSLRSRTAPLHRPTPAPRVAVVEWVDPPILAGLWTPDIVRAAGGVSIGPRRGRPGERTRWEAIAAEGPDLLVISPCSFGVERTVRELSVPAVRDGLRAISPRLGTFVADEAYFSRPGPRLADGVELIRHLLAREPWQPPMPYAAYPPSPLEATA